MDASRSIVYPDGAAFCDPLCPRVLNALPETILALTAVVATAYPVTRLWRYRVPKLADALLCQGRLANGQQVGVLALNKTPKGRGRGVAIHAQLKTSRQTLQRLTRKQIAF